MKVCRLVAAVVVTALLALAPACVTSGEADPSADELAELDAWAATADGKADAPPSYAEVIAWLRVGRVPQLHAVSGRA